MLKSTIAAVCAALSIAHAEEKSASASSSFVTNGDGTATVTVTVNGKTETRTIKLGEGGPFTLKIEDGGAVAAADAGKPAKVEKKVPWLGIATEPVPDEVRAQIPIKLDEGLSVSHVMPDSPAAKAGIEKFDIITRIDDQVVVSPDQVRTLVKMRKAGDKTKITLLRKGQQREVSAVIEEHDEVVGEAGGFRFRDNLRDHLKEMKKRFPGVIVEKRGWLLGPGGELKNLDVGENLDEALKAARKHLDELNLPIESQNAIRSAVEEALRAAEQASKAAAEAARQAADAVKKKNPESRDEKKPEPPPAGNSGEGRKL